MTDEERLVRLETEIVNLRETQMKQMNDNIKDLEKKIEKLDARIWMILTGVLATLLTVVIDKMV
jgi:phage shock protein A